MAEIQKYSLVEELHKADKTLQGSPSVLGMTMLTYPNYINSMRSTMFTSHLKQFLNLLDPQFPHVFTNDENIVGKGSSGYKQAKANLKIVKKIAKFEDIVDTPRIYKLFVYDEENEQYDVITRKVCENLTENFGFEYINDVIDSFEEGDTISKDTVMYRSTSYDEDMNYGYGRNVTVAYTLDPFTSEDAAVASRSLTKQFTSIETEIMTIGLNGNDYLLNIYGDKKHYKPLPDIGEIISDKFAVVRRQFNNQLLFDFKDSSLREIHEGDSIYYVDKNVEIVDYTIYNNEDEEIDNPFYEQINKYYKSQFKYYEEILEMCNIIKHSGKKYSGEIENEFTRARDQVDKIKKWKDGDNSYPIELEITIKRDVPLAKGCKVTGRYGNKSVISQIREDEDMPYTKDGRRVDLLLNLLAIINRTTSFVLYEIFMNGAAYQVRMKMKELSTLEEKENMLFDFIKVLNEDQASKMYKDYSKLTKKKKENYIQDAIDNGILIHQTPMWEKIPIFYRCQNVLKQFPFIHKDDLYIKKWGREYKMLTKYFVGEMYILKLKQSDRRGFSARSTGALDTKSLPTRSFKSRSHLERISSSCIRFGEFESFNFSIGILPEDIALFHALYRTSIKGRKDIISVMFGDDGAIEKIDPSYTSRVSEIFNVILKSLGIGLEFLDDEDEVKVLNDDNVTQHTIDGKTIMCTDYQYYLIERFENIKHEILEDNPVLTEQNLKQMIENIMKKRHYINGPLNEEIGKTFDLDLKKELDIEYNKLLEEKKTESLEKNNNDESTTDNTEHSIDDE